MEKKYRGTGNCELQEAMMIKTDNQFCKFVTDNNLPFTTRE